MTGRSCPQLTLYAIRHAETAWNAEGRLQGTQESPLSPKGRRQAERLSAALADRPVVAVYTAATGRAVATAQPLAAGLGLVPCPTPALNEMDLGDWQGLTFAQVQQRWPEQHTAFWESPQDYRPAAGGESFEDLHRRTSALLDALAQGDGHVVLVTHSLVIKALWLVATRRPLADFWVTDEFMPASISSFQLDAREWTIGQLNNRDHLPAELL